MSPIEFSILHKFIRARPRLLAASICAPMFAGPLPLAQLRHCSVATLIGNTEVAANAPLDNSQSKIAVQAYRK